MLFFLTFSFFSFQFHLVNGYEAFFAVMVTNPTVVQQVSQIQQNLTTADRQFVSFLHNTSHLHVHLNDFEINDTSIPKILADLPKILCNVSSSIPVMFAGTEIRANRTLFGKMNAMSSSVITTVHKTILNYLNESGIDSLDKYQIFQSKMDIVELDERKHDDLLKIMSNQTFRLSTGDFVKEIVMFKAAPSGFFHDEIGRFQLQQCSSKLLELLTNRIYIDYS